MAGQNVGAAEIAAAVVVMVGGVLLLWRCHNPPPQRTRPPPDPIVTTKDCSHRQIRLARDMQSARNCRTFIGQTREESIRHCFGDGPFDEAFAAWQHVSTHCPEAL